MTTNAQLYWHIHHGTLMEPLTEPIENRIAYIKAQEPLGEQEPRLRLLKPVVGSLPAKFVTAVANFDTAVANFDAARAKYDATRDRYYTAWDRYYTARAEYDATLAKYAPKIKALHRLECPNCPWDGRTISPKGEA